MESRILGLIGALRARGVRVSVAESSEALAAVQILGIQQRDRFRMALRATLMKNARDAAAFDELFELFFGGAPARTSPTNAWNKLSPKEAEVLAQLLQTLVASHRSDVERLLAGEPLSEADLRAAARAARIEDRAADFRISSAVQSIFRTLRLAELQEAMESLLNQLARAGSNDKSTGTLRDTLLNNLDSWKAQAAAFAGQRLRENRLPSTSQEGASGLLTRPFSRLTGADRNRVEREVTRMAAALRTKLALRQKRSRRGNLDTKGTIRANLRNHGVPIRLQHRFRARKPRLVMICDVSTSMRYCAELMLTLVFSVQNMLTKATAFAFIDHLEEISSDLAGVSPAAAVTAVLLRMPPGHYNTDLGASLAEFHRYYLHTLDRQTTLLVLGDGRNNFNDPKTELFHELGKRAARVIWLNPEPAGNWDGDSDMRKYAPLCDEVLKVASPRELAVAVDRLLTHSSQGRPR
jgi:uncharacterized protein with von Willebrand factor type A (vWA) domain